MVPPLRVVEELVTWKRQVRAVFASFSPVRFALRPPRSPSLLTVRGSRAVEEGGVTDHLSQLAVHKSTGLRGAAEAS